MRESAWEALGGREGVERIVDELIERASSDLMIGFFFRAADLDRVKRHELELASSHLGGPVGYSGQPLPEAHRAHPIATGHFQRRLKLLEEVLTAAGAPAWVCERWLDHDRSQQAAVVQRECNQGMSWLGGNRVEGARASGRPLGGRPGGDPEPPGAEGL